MRLLLRHSDKRQRVENGLALYFQFSREIVYSNLHPTFLFPRARYSSQPHGANFVHPHTFELACACHIYSVVSGAEPWGSRSSDSSDAVSGPEDSPETVASSSTAASAAASSVGASPSAGASSATARSAAPASRPAK